MPSCRPAPRGRTRNTTSCPLFSPPSTLVKSSGLLTGTLLISSTMSPRFKPMSSANDRALLPALLRPCPLEYPAGQPIQALRRVPLLRACSPSAFLPRRIALRHRVAMQRASSDPQPSRSLRPSWNCARTRSLLSIQACGSQFQRPVRRPIYFLAIDRDDRVAYL